MARGKRGSGFNRLKYENCAIKKAIIFSNESDLDVDLTAAPDVQYAESIFSDTIEVDVTLSNTVGTVEGKTLMEGLPLVGTEDFTLKITEVFDEASGITTEEIESGLFSQKATEVLEKLTKKQQKL